ncbi:4507_t:CDS:2, partial [Paraglomus brasilianum]
SVDSCALVEQLSTPPQKYEMVQLDQKPELGNLKVTEPPQLDQIPESQRLLSTRIIKQEAEIREDKEALEGHHMNLATTGNLYRGK